jgi:Ca2+-binding EF-hand superfamily protein/mono/diheme cytochrome c family protein
MRPPFASAVPLLVLSALGSAGTADAQTLFDRVDRNRDGRITRDELANATAFGRFDRDGDGVITREEYARLAGSGSAGNGSAGGRTIETVVRQLDADGDGRITRAEAGAAPWFERVDANGDGVIEAGELERVRRLAARGDATPAEPTAGNPAVTAQEVRQVTSGPEVLKAGEVGVGRMVPDVAFMDLAGRSFRLGELARARKAVVVAMTSATCPVSKRYLPSLAALDRELAAQEIALVLVNPFASESAAEIAAQLAAAGIASTYVHDREQAVATALGARTTTEVFLIDPARTLVYRGALDDQYGIDYNLAAPRHAYLRAAVAALLEHRVPAVQATAAPGCELDLDPAEAGAGGSPVTYHRDVARILQQSCVSCHRPGGIAPFALDDPAAVKERARTIGRVVREGTMPPWFAAPPAEGAATPWANDRALSARDKADLLAWIASTDRPAGDPAEAPVKRVYPREWSIGPPDAVIPLSRAYDIQATGFMPYQFDVVRTEFAEDKWVSAYEILPSERDVVHHVIVQVYERGAPAVDREEGAGGYWAVYVPGNGAHVYPEGFARRIPAGATVTFQIHYTPSGVAKKERLRLGLVFAPAPPRYEVKTAAVAQPRLAIPPGAAHHVETRSQRVPFDMPVTSFMAHMHVRGKAFKYEVTYPDGNTETLLDIPRYDFNWQLRYDLKQPKLLPRGSTVKITAVYDNSPGNRANPDPTKLVRWGRQTVDEMMIGYLEYFVPLAVGVAAR